MYNSIPFFLYVVIFIYIGNNILNYYMYQCYLSAVQFNNVYCKPYFFIRHEPSITMSVIF